MVQGRHLLRWGPLTWILTGSVLTCGVVGGKAGGPITGEDDTGDWMGGWRHLQCA